MKKSTKVAVTGAGVGAVGTGGTMVGITAGLSGPAANLGGYATAQIIAGSVGTGGPALATAIAAVGGPIVAGGIVIVGTGAAIYGGIKLLSRLFSRR